MNGQSLAGRGLLFLYGVVLPVAVCWLRRRQPEYFKGGKLLLWFCGSATFSWGFVNAAILVPYYLGLYVPRGREIVFALFIGWLYLWAAALPVLNIDVLLRLVRWNKQKKNIREAMMSTVWTSLIFDTACTIVFMLLPAGVCAAHWLRPTWFGSGNRFPTPVFKCLAWAAGLSLVSWIFVAGGMVIATATGNPPDNGFAVVCAYFLGWLYIWFFMIPIAILYGILRLSAGLIRKRLQGKSTE